MKSLAFTASVVAALGYLLFADRLSGFNLHAAWPDSSPRRSNELPSTPGSTATGPRAKSADRAQGGSSDPPLNLNVQGDSDVVPATGMLAPDTNSVLPPELPNIAGDLGPVPTAADVSSVTLDLEPISAPRTAPESLAIDLLSSAPPDTILDARALRRLAADLEIAAGRARLR